MIVTHLKAQNRGSAAGESDKPVGPVAPVRPPANARLPVAITMGDPSGIGPEIVVKYAAARESDDHPFVVVGDVGTLRRAALIAGVDVAVRPVTHASEAWGLDVDGRTLAVLQTGPEPPDDLAFGQITASAGAAAYAYVTRAIDLALAGEVAALVTAPIHKAAMKAAGLLYPGHTEILASRCGVRECAMMLANDDLRVLLVSSHLSLADAIDAITMENEMRAIHLAANACGAFGIRRPRVAVAGLNPHAGESGMFGRQEIDIIAPAVARSQAEGLNVSGPWPADTVFMRGREGEFDVVVAQYHDQGLIPVKYLGLDHGANITVGLPFVRTSVDHGTAFDIAGKGTASPASLIYAFKQALALATASRAMQASSV